MTAADNYGAAPAFARCSLRNSLRLPSLRIRFLCDGWKRRPWCRCGFSSGSPIRKRYDLCCFPKVPADARKPTTDRCDRCPKFGWLDLQLFRPVLNLRRIRGVYLDRIVVFSGHGSVLNKGFPVGITSEYFGGSKMTEQRSNCCVGCPTYGLVNCELFAV